MMSKRRQTLGIQIASAFAIFVFIAYFFLPTSTPLKPPAHVDKPSTLLGDKLDLQDFQLVKTPKNRVKAAFVILARNSDLNGVRFAMRQVEDRFNRKFNYPYVFLNEEDFTSEFKALTATLTKANTFYGKIDSSMWGYPEHINTTHAAECRKNMADQKIIYGGSEPYRHMCR